MRSAIVLIAAACVAAVPGIVAADDDVYVLESHATLLYQNFVESEFGPFYPAEYPTQTLGYGGAEYYYPGPNYHPTNALSYYVPAAPSYYASPAALYYPIQPRGFYAPTMPYGPIYGYGW